VKNTGGVVELVGSTFARVVNVRFKSALCAEVVFKQFLFFNMY